MKAWRRTAPAVTKPPTVALDIQRHLNNEPVLARPPSRLIASRNWFGEIEWYLRQGTGIALGPRGWF